MARKRISIDRPVLRKKPSGIYEMVWYEDGVRRRRTTGHRDPTKAKAAVQTIVARETRCELGKNPNVSQLAEVYLLHQVPWKTDRQHATMRCALKLSTDRMGDVQINDFGQEHVDALIQSLQTEVPSTRKSGYYSPSTIRKALGMLRACFYDSEARRYILRAPRFRIRISDAPARNEYLSHQQVQSLLDRCDIDFLNQNCRTSKFQHFQDRSHLEGFILIAVTTAARKQAILDLRWRDVHLAVKTSGAAVEADSTGYDWIDFGQANGKKKKPRIPISHSPRLLSWLRRRANDSDPDDRVLLYRGKPISDIKKGLETLYDEAGIPRPRAPAHIFKHTAITWMIQADVPLSSIAALTNTSEIMLRNVYGHHSPDYRMQLSNLSLPS